MTRLFLACLAAAGLLLLAFGLAAASEAKTPMQGADEAYEKYYDRYYRDLAVTRYEQVLAMEPKNPEAHWKLARAYYQQGIKEPGEDKKIAIFQKAIDQAKRGIELKGDCVDCYYWLAVNYGVYGEAKGVMKSLFLVEPIKEAIGKVIELDPDYDQGAAWRLLGRVNHKVPWLAGGSKKEAEKQLKKALELGPDSILTRVYLAETLMANGKDDEARGVLRQALSSPQAQDPKYACDLNDAKVMFDKYFQKD